MNEQADLVKTNNNRQDSVEQSITTLSPAENSGGGVFVDAPPPIQTTLPHFPASADQLTRNDLILLQQSVVKGWPLSEESKAQAVKQAEWIRDNAKSDPRLKLRAVEFLLSVAKHNLDVVKAFQPQQPTTAVQVNVNSGSSDLSRLSDAELEQRIRELRGG